MAPRWCLLETRSMLWCVEMLDKPPSFLAGFHLSPFGLTGNQVWANCWPIQTRSKQVYTECTIYIATWAHVLLIAIITLCFHIYCIAKWQRSHIKPVGLALISQSTQHYEPGVTFLLIFKVSLACQTKKDAAGKQFVHNRARGHFYM